MAASCSDLNVEALDTTTVVETPERVRFRYQVAGPAARICAYLIDALVRFAILMALTTFWGLAGAFGGEGLTGVGTGVILASVFAVEWGYYVLLETTMGGQSIGKRALRLRVVTSEGRPLTFVDSVLRNLLRAADILPLTAGPGAVLPAAYALGLAVMVQDSKFRRIGDLVAGTLVISERRQSLHGVLTIDPPPTRQELATLPARVDLSPRELESIELLLRRAGEYSPARVEELAAIVAPRFAENRPIPGAGAARFLALIYYRATQRLAGAHAR